jgi:hypothetical protein
MVRLASCRRSTRRSATTVTGGRDHRDAARPLAGTPDRRAQRQHRRGDRWCLEVHDLASSSSSPAGIGIPSSCGSCCGSAWWIRECWRSGWVSCHCLRSESRRYASRCGGCPAPPEPLETARVRARSGLATVAPQRGESADSRALTTRPLQSHRLSLLLRHGARPRLLRSPVSFRVNPGRRSADPPRRWSPATIA